MNAILNLIKKNPINYTAEIESCEAVIRHSGGVYISVIIPVRGRIDFLPTLLGTLQKARQHSFIDITVVEDSDTPAHKPTCLKYGVNYIWHPNVGVFNKCLAFNLGVFLGNKGEWIICHDLDMLVQKDFFIGITHNLYNQKLHALQSFSNHKPVNCDEFLTKRLLSGVVDINELHSNSNHTFRAKGDAPGGSITLSRDLFFAIGGYDPELFTGYSPEDRFFIDKIQTYEAMGTCDNPVIHVFHMHHPPMQNTNPHLKDMIAIADKFAKLCGGDRTKIIQYKEKLIEQFQ